MELDLDMGKCQNCKQRTATKKWLGDGGALALVHGGGQNWCEICVLRAQIEYAEAAVQRLSTLKARLASLEELEAMGQPQLPLGNE